MASSLEYFDRGAEGKFVTDYVLSDRLLVDALDEPALIIEKNIVNTANRAAKALLGRGIEGRDVRLAMRQPELLDLILAGKEGDRDVAGIGEAGRPWRVSVRYLTPATQFVRLTDRAEAIAAERMRVDFVANASHELRTPLAAVMGFAETLADEEDSLDPATTARFGKTIRDEAARMLDIVEDLMSLSRIEAERFIVPDQKVDVAAIINGAIANAETIRRGKSCDIVIELGAALPPVRGDEVQLVQVLDNLISNALRYGCDKPGSSVSISAIEHAGWLNIEVTDQGPGIERKHLPRLTERFYRVDDARSRENGGTGLGLAIVKHIVERHRGTLAIDSKVGRGTTVKVSLPAAS